MYKARRTDAYFRGEVDKLIQAAENHAIIEKTQMIHCPCRTCKNLRVFSDTTIIRSHVLISGFVDCWYFVTSRIKSASARIPL